MTKIVIVVFSYPQLNGRQHKGKIKDKQQSKKLKSAPEWLAVPVPYVNIILID